MEQKKRFKGDNYEERDMIPVARFKIKRTQAVYLLILDVEGQLNKINDKIQLMILSFWKITFSDNIFLQDFNVGFILFYSD